MTPPLPVAPSQPSNSAASGGTWASGNSQVNASGSVSSVEYAEYRQWLTIEYSRNPHYTHAQNSNPYWDLVQCSAVDVVDVGGTELHMTVRAHTSCTIVSGSYNASSFYQPQKFRVLPQEYDKIGVSYGPVSGITAGSGIAFGPAGKIITSQPMIDRHPRLVGESAYYSTKYGTSHGLFTSATYSNSVTFHPGDNLAQDYEYYLNYGEDLAAAQAVNAHSLNRYYATRQAQAAPRMNMYGAYNTSSEPGFGDYAQGIAELEQFVTATADCLQATHYSDRFCIAHPQSSNGNQTGWGHILEADRLDQMTYYNAGHHDFT